MRVQPIRPEMADHPLSVAAREVNAYAEKHGLQETCEHYNLAVEDIRYMAEQRGLRVLWARRGKNLNIEVATILALTTEESEALLMLTAGYMDALVIGWRAREIQAEREGEK
jgi:hypothetical protein